ncbi:hypothetical protein D5S17_32765 [Pseudonocardiaceae bacterium YIM PH 21723]|nr:hypothetical protein D5S17_32765 [Pseudonocardiaceae bacterium YIM PH 21723]
MVVMLAPTVTVHGAEKLRADLTQMTRNADRATIAATKKVQNKVKAAVRKNLNGRPRWNHRGKSAIFAEQVNIPGAPRNSPRSGGPGKFTGDLRRGVGGRRRLVSLGGRVVGGVGVGGGGIPQNNLKKADLEDKYPFFAPGYRSVQTELPAIYAAAWEAAVLRMGGL